MSSIAQAGIVWYWDDDFSQAEQRLLTAWLTQTQQAVEGLVGALPFDVHVHLHRRNGSDEPVPWANTDRRRRQSLHFYVDTAFDSDDFLDDWTAPHEFAHLILPYLGRENAWFAEGFASYLQHLVMLEMGRLTPAQVRERRDARMRRAIEGLRGSPVPLPERVPELRSRRAYPTFYWGGAIYFERVDAALRERALSLVDVLGRYLDCCRLSTDGGLSGLVAELDRLSDSALFSRELEVMHRTPGIPRRPEAFRAP